MLSRKNKIIEPGSLLATVKAWRQENKTIATLNGSFDLLHAGHLFMLEQAALQADVLLVALNSDASIKKYKCVNRPIVPLKYRLELIAALEMVDAVTWFEETEPSLFIRTICPHVHVNGAEYGENCIELSAVQEVGARLHLVRRIPGLSTSEIVDKIKCI